MAPWIWQERTNVGFLFRAAPESGFLALYEPTTNNQVDLWLYSHDHNSEFVWAKYMHLAGFDPLQLQQRYQANQAQAGPPQNLNIGGVQHVSVIFISFFVPLAAGQAAILNSIEMFIQGARGHAQQQAIPPIHALAWSFPAPARLVILPQHGAYFPGVVLIASVGIHGFGILSARSCVHPRPKIKRLG